MCASLHCVVYTYCFVDSAAFYLFDSFAELYTFPHWFCNFCSLSCLNARIYHYLIDMFVFVYIAWYDKCHCIKQTVCEMYLHLIPTLDSNNYPSHMHVLTYHWVMTFNFYWRFVFNLDKLFKHSHLIHLACDINETDVGWWLYIV